MHLARLLTLLAAAALAAAPAAAQTIKSLGYNATNGNVVYSGTNPLTFTNSLQFATNARAATRTNLGGTTVGNAVFTATNAAAGATALELGTTNNVTFNNLTTSGTLTATGNVTMNGVGNTAPSQTASSAASLMTRGLSDARYGLPSLLKMETNISSVTSTAASETYSTESVTLAAGTYEVTAQLMALCDSATAGITVGVTDATQAANGVGVFVGSVAVSSTFDDGAFNGLLLGPAFGAVTRNGSQNYIFAFTDSAARRTMYYSGMGFLTLTATRTFKFSILQRHGTDASNPAVLQADRSFVVFKKIY
jgi:hypothetical protein